MIIQQLRKYIGIITSFLGFVILCILTFGDLGSITGDAYWRNVMNNLTSIGFMSVGLTFIQVAIKQGLAEQALQRGLNTPVTTSKFEEHKELIRASSDRMIYITHFLHSYNKRMTLMRRREFLINNNYTTEESLLLNGKKSTIKKYNSIRINIALTNIKWATTNIQYDKRGRIMTLNEYRKRRATSAVLKAVVMMGAMTLVANGLFFTPSNVPIWQKIIKILTYIVTITVSSVFGIVKNYEKGAFGVPNELDEINEIWKEFSRWEIPAWVQEEIDTINKKEEENERKESVNERTDIQKEQTESENL